MKSVAELSRREKAFEVLRWACVLPAAAIIGTAAHYAGGLVGMIVDSAWGTAAESALVYGVQFAAFYVPKKAAFVLGGALTAPRYRVATAVVLAAVATIMSLIVHVLGQRTVGATNYLHFATESAAAAGGAICVAIARRSAISHRES